MPTPATTPAIIMWIKSENMPTHNQVATTSCLPLISYALGQKKNCVIFEVSSFLLVLNEGHDRLPNSVSPIAEMTIFAMDVVLWCNFPPSEQ